MDDMVKFKSMSDALDKLVKRYERGEIKHFDYVNQQESLFRQFGYTKQKFIEKLSKIRNKNLLK